MINLKLEYIEQAVETKHLGLAALCQMYISVFHICLEITIKNGCQ